MNAQVKEKLQKLFNSAYFISKVSTAFFLNYNYALYQSTTLRSPQQKPMYCERHSSVAVLITMKLSQLKFCTMILQLAGNGTV